jgi:hydrogenase maturation protein HypF
MVSGVSSLVSPRTRVPLERRSIVVTGVVQGVGFRPFVHRVATELGLTGFVQNASGEVRIEAEGGLVALEDFILQLTFDAPKLARIQGVRSSSEAPLGYRDFRILESTGQAGANACPACGPRLRCEPVDVAGGGPAEAAGDSALGAALPLD